MRERFRSFDSKISFFAFADIITAVSGMLIFITLLLATDLGKPTDNHSQEANEELQRKLQETLNRQADADVANRGLQNLLTTANTAPAPAKLESDISRLRTELTNEKSKHAGIEEQLAASKTAIEERDKLVGITAVREHIQEGLEELKTLAEEDSKIRNQTADLEKKIIGVQSKVLKYRSRQGQLWLIPDKSGNTKEPVLAIVSGKDLTIEIFDHPEQTQKFTKSGARDGFATFLKHSKPAKQYIVFLVRPTGIEMFRDLLQDARDKGFEVGFDALEENREIHFMSPPPIEEDAAPDNRPEIPIAPGTTGPERQNWRGPGGSPGSAGSAGTAGSTGTASTTGHGGGTGGNGSTGPGGPTGTSESTAATGANSTGTANSTNTTGSNGAAGSANSTNSMGSTNSVGQTGTNSGSTPGMSPTAESQTNTTPSTPPPPPKPKSWWQRLLEWIGLG